MHLILPLSRVALIAYQLAVWIITVAVCFHCFIHYGRVASCLNLTCGRVALCWNTLRYYLLLIEYKGCMYF